MANARRRTQRITTRSNTRSTMTRPTGTEARVAVFESDADRASKALDWQAQYKYVTSDLRQLLVVSVILFVLLFVAGFFI